MFVLPVILFIRYKKMADDSIVKKFLFFLLLLFQITITLLLIDGEGRMLYQELNGGEGMQIALSMLLIAYLMVGVCLVISIIIALIKKIVTLKKK